MNKDIAWIIEARKRAADRREADQRLEMAVAEENRRRKVAA